MASSARGFSAQFWALVGSTFLGFLGIGTVLPLLAPHIRYDLGGSDQDIGFVVGIFSFVALLGRLISGPLADRRGRKISFLTGLVCCAAAGLIYLLPMGMAGAYLARIFQGMGEAFLYTGAAAWVVELAGIERSAQALGYLSSGIWGGISAGPVVGQWLGTFPHAAMMQTAAAIIAFIVLTRVPEDYHPEPHAPGRQWLPRSIWAPGIAIGFVNVQYPVIAGFLILHLKTHGNSGPMAFSAYAGMILLSRFFLGGLPDRIEPFLTFYGGITLMAAGLLVLASGPGPVIAVGATALLGFGFSFPWSSIAATVLRRTPSSERGSAVGILSAFYDLFVGVSSFAAGWVAHQWGYSAAFVMAATALIAAALAGRYVFFTRPAVRENAMTAEGS
ncbi:MAG: MFS transporter [Candidatus Solibacter sp.]